MKKILLCAPYSGISGGISRWTSHILEYYKKNVCTDCQLSLLPMNRNRFVSINMPTWKRVWSAWVDYRKILAEFNKEIKLGYDVMHLTSSGSLSLYKDLYMLRRARKFGSKTIVHFRFGRIPELAQQKNREWKLIEKVVRKADKVIVIDRMSYDTFISCGFKNIEILPNPIAPIVEQIVADNKNIRRVPRQILFTGHVIKTKGVFELLKACSTLDNIHLSIVGYVLPEIQQEIENTYGKPEWLMINGEKTYEEVIKDMMRCDVFVLPTYTEGFPNVILEAMAAGCAIVSTPVGAIPQMLEDDDNGKYGQLVEPRNVIALSDAIKSLLDDAPLKNEMRQNVRRRVHERYNISSVWEKMVVIWENC